MSKIFVGNLPWAITEQEIRDFFAPLQLKSVRIIVDRETKKPRGFGFVEVKDEDDQIALSYNGSDLSGRNCIVNPAIEKSAAERSRPRNEKEYEQNWK